ncbi:unnamed protein product [Lactuca virosa]|uniref:TF-B3 domain-containing protein n=1 Tax=Lactuca virosa TaxID=75947 RepID=A0AAU9NYE1_9ASTR|nr:unnamed protein product [Lactuca virosa]
MMDARRPHFIKGFNPNISFDKLKIPSKFGKHLEGKTSGTVSLMGPSGNTWHADLAQQSDVQIFDQSSCEKETAFSAECHQDLSIFDQHFGKKREREYASLLSNMVDGVPKKPRSSQSHNEPTNISEQETMDGVADFLNGSEFCGSGLKNSITPALPVSAVRPNEEELGRISASEAEKIAQTFNSSFPHFSQVMKRFNISGSYTLNVPYQFAMAYLPNCKVKIVLQNLKGESWTVNSIPTTKVQTAHTFCGGWLGFVRGNNINVRDVCIFELVGNCEMRVNILRVRQEAIEYEQQEQQHGSSDVKGLTHKTAGKLAKKAKGKSRKTQKLSMMEGQKVAFSIEKVKLGIAAKGSVVGSQSKTTTNGKPGKERVLKEKRGSSMTGCMSMKSAPEEKMAAESFVSSFPYFVRVMKKFNVSGSYTLKVPYQFSMEHLPSCRTEIILQNLKGECWTVNSIPTLKVETMHTLHTFCGGWMGFSWKSVSFIWNWNWSWTFKSVSHLVHNQVGVFFFFFFNGDVADLSEVIDVRI